MCVCVSNLAHLYPQILHRNCAALLHGISMTFFVVMFDHFPLARYQLLHSTPASPNSDILVTPHHFTLLWHTSRTTILPWTFHEFLLELICILSRYNPTNFASDLTLTFCVTVTVCLNPPTGIYQRTVEKQWP